MIAKNTIQTIDKFIMFIGKVDWRLIGIDGKRYYELYILCRERWDLVSVIE
jgi:hypothetical protein